MTTTGGVEQVWLERAWLGAHEGASRGVLLDLAGDRIAALATDQPPPPGARRLAGLTLPGLVSAHGHAFHRALRGRTQGGTGDFWTWREAMYAVAGRLDPDQLADLATAAYAELALAGVTTVGEFHYLHHDPAGQRYRDPNETGRAMLAAAERAGVRITLLDTCYLSAGFGAPPEGVQVRFADADADAWAERAAVLTGSPTARIGAAVHSVRAVDPPAARSVAQWAQARSAPVHAHLSEQPAENAACLEHYGATPAKVLASTGLWGAGATAVHATHLTAADIALLGRTGASVCLCPTTERDLADGVGPARELADAGSPLCLGTDSHAVADLFEEARAIELDARLATGRRGVHPPVELLAAATAGGAGSLGWPEAGRIAPGMLADLTTVALDSPRTAGTGEDWAAVAVFTATSADVTDVCVGGRVVVSEGRHVRLDVVGELARAVRAAWDDG